MEFSLGGSLDHYINPGSNTNTSHSNSDSLRSIGDLGRLELYFRQKKEANSKIIDQLWSRVEQCESKCLQLTESVDLSYSRIHDDSKTLNIQRYEDLLPHSFKEVEWAKSSRVVVVHEHNDKAKAVEKYQTSIDNLQNSFQLIMQEQAKALSNLQADFYHQIKKTQQQILARQAQSQAVLHKLQHKLSLVDQSLQQQQLTLQTTLHKLYESLSTLISDRIFQIQQQVAHLSA